MKQEGNIESEISATGEGAIVEIIEAGAGLAAEITETQAKTDQEAIDKIEEELGITKTKN